MTEVSKRIGAVVIGRNEGRRLQRCLLSIVGQVDSVVYVDSGSTDQSVVLAKTLGVGVIELDTATPFCAARARNAGYEALICYWPDTQLVQFVDGDCELFPDWLSDAADILAQREEVAAIAGRLRERHPDASIYNRIGEMEWNFLGFGDVGSVGGIFMIRRTAFESVGGFDPTVSAGEEPELCQRLTEKGWIVSRHDVDMAWHDLAMTRFSQWWRRQVRGGAGALDMTIRFRLRRFLKHVLRAQFWSAWLLSFLVTLVWGRQFSSPQTFVVLVSMIIGLWALQFSRIALRTARQGQKPRVAISYAFLTMISYWPQMLGQIRCLIDHACNRQTRLIEYKGVSKKSDATRLPEEPSHGRK